MCLFGFQVGITGHGEQAILPTPHGADAGHDTPLTSTLADPAPRDTALPSVFDATHVVAFGGSPVADQYGIAVVERGQRRVAVALATGDQPTEDEVTAVVDRFVDGVASLREAAGLSPLEVDEAVSSSAATAARRFHDLQAVRFAPVAAAVLEPVGSTWLAADNLAHSDPSVAVLGPYATLGPDDLADLTPYAAPDGETLGTGFYLPDRENWTFVAAPLGDEAAISRQEADTADAVLEAINIQRTERGLDALPEVPALRTDTDRYATTIAAVMAEGGNPRTFELHHDRPSDVYLSYSWSGPFRTLPRMRTIDVNQEQFAVNATGVAVGVHIDPRSGLTIVAVAMLSDGDPSVRAADR